jgi:hypothetical protein
MTNQQAVGMFLPSKLMFDWIWVSLQSITLSAVRNPSRIWLAISATAPGPCGRKTAEDFYPAPISFMVSKYSVIRTKSMTSLAEVPGTLPLKPSTLSLSPSTMACRCRAMPRPDRYLASASPSALLIWMIFSASAFSFAATRSLAAEQKEK